MKIVTVVLILIGLGLAVLIEVNLSSGASGGKITPKEAFLDITYKGGVLLILAFLLRLAFIKTGRPKS